MLKEQESLKKNKEIIEKLNQKSQFIHKKHGKQMNALEMKIKANWLRHWTQREKEIEVIKKRYKNSKHDLTQKYKQDWLKLTKQSPIAKMTIKEQISDFQS